MQRFNRPRGCPPASAERPERGSSLIEILVVVCIAAGVVAMATPSVVTATDAGRAREAAAFLAGRLRAAKQQAVLQSASTALVFDQVGTRWTFRVCIDGNGNGIRRSEIAKGQDTCVDGPYDVAALFPGVAIDVDASLKGPDGEAGSADPVRFGASNVASFSPAGTCTSGSVFVRSARGEQFIVRVAGVNGRLRVLRYDKGSKGWRDS